jgi:hypothetical protein
MNTLAAFDLTTTNTVAPHSAAFCFSILPENSAIIHTGLTHSETVNFDSWEHQVRQLPQGLRFFINHSYDPVKISDADIVFLLDLIKTHHPGSDPIFLSSKCSHYFANIPGIVYFPYFFFSDIKSSLITQKSKRFGCLNRNNQPHRLWLMHNLLNRGLLDSDKDIYSVSFVNPRDLSCYSIVDTWLDQIDAVDHLIRQYPRQIATHPDGFPNDVDTVNHPAWHTAIVIVTETETNDLTIISEKTIKAIVAESCWTAYMGESGYRLLEAFGFAPRFFEQHAQGTNIDPILKICSMLDTQSAAVDYRNQHLEQIKYNSNWYGNNIKSRAQHKVLLARTSAPWFNQWYPNFQQSIN